MEQHKGEGVVDTEQDESRRRQGSIQPSQRGNTEDKEEASEEDEATKARQGSEGKTPAVTRTE